MAIQWRKLKHSFSHAFRGIKEAWETQQNFRIHSYFVVLVLILSFIFSLSLIEFSFIFMFIMFVIVSELMNTSIEYFADYVQPERDESIKKIKDISAAAVLISVVASLISGLLIFIPKIYCLFFC